MNSVDFSNLNNQFHSIPLSQNYKNSISNEIISIPKLCTRCNIISPTIICGDCYPLIYFCSICDENIHEMKTMQNHKRISINELNKSIKNINNENIISDDYFNMIKSIIDKKKQKLMNKSYIENKVIENTKNDLDEKTNNIDTTMIDSLEKENLEKKKIEELKYKNEMKKINIEKDNKIRNLLLKNEELSEYNKQLEEKLNVYINDLNDLINKNEYDNTYLNNQMNNSKNEYENILKYYESKLGYLNENIKDDKAIFINSCEEKMNTIKNYYLNEKERLLNGINQSENNLNLLCEQHRKNQDDIKNEIERQKLKDLLKNKESEKLFNQFLEQEKKIGELRINIKKNQFLIKGEKEKLKLAKKDNKRLLRIYHYLMKRLEILNKISRGKLLRKEEIEFLNETNPLNYLL